VEIHAEGVHPDHDSGLFVGTGLIKVLTGQRRVGKSFLLFQLMDGIRKQDKAACILYINKEDYRFEKLKTHEDLMAYVKTESRGRGSRYLFIDEVQDIQGFELALRSLLTVDDRDGMPHLVNLPKDDTVVSEYLRNIHNTIVLRDIIARFNIRNVRFLRDLITYLAEITGSVVSAKRISDYLESVFFVDRVKRKDVAGKKVFDVGEKFYFEDLGMRHAIIPFQQKDIAKVLENLVCHQLVVVSHQVYVVKLGEREVDFVATKDEQTTYVQVTYRLPDERTHEREFGNLLAIPDNHKKNSGQHG
jgi:uncharacterized protein